jgi:DeoR/GlpR family transcriptional regulator of sugar metabolism/ABC-type sugar transport system substrate-binding protein
MLKLSRSKEILQLVNEQGTVTVRELTEAFNVTDVTIRRDLQELEEQGLLLRTHGGAVRLEPNVVSPAKPSAPEHNGNGAVTDALIIAPVQNRIAHTLRERALREHIPLLAESVPFEGATYLGPDNYGAAVELGQWTGDYVRQHGIRQPRLLDLTAELPNSEARSSGFIHGLRNVVGDELDVVSVHGQYVYSAAYHVAFDALRVHRDINILFGINDDLILAAIQAALDLGREPDSFIAVNIGGEGKTIFDVLARRGPLKACLALFPEIVGRKGVDATLRLWNGDTSFTEVITPAAVLTADNLTDYYTRDGDDWRINLAAVDRLAQTHFSDPAPALGERQLSFIIHFRTHEWYQNIAKAMQARAREVGISVRVEDVNDDLRAEIIELRRLIGKIAANYVRDGDTIYLDAGTTTTNMAQFLGSERKLTVITPSLAIFQQLQRNPNIHLILTGGEYLAESHSLVGRGPQLFLSELRVDKAFVVAGGVSADFGVSCKNQQEAEVRRAAISASREVVLLADHTVIGTDSRVFVTHLHRVNTLITDAGIRSEDRLDFIQRGIRVLAVGEV